MCMSDQTPTSLGLEGLNLASALLRGFSSENKLVCKQSLSKVQASGNLRPKVAMEELQEACRTATPSLETLLSDPNLSSVALSPEPPHPNKDVPRRPNLGLLMCTAAESGHLSCVQVLLKFGHINKVHYNIFISREAICDALKSKNNAILKEFIKAWPDVVNLNMGHGCHPLMQTLLKDNFHLSAYLLDHGAHVNAVCGPDKGPGGYIRLAAKQLPLQYTTLLLSHGAHIA